MGVGPPWLGWRLADALRRRGQRRPISGVGGFNSGEAVADALRDPSDVDNGTEDKRLLVYEPEFARLLKAAARDGSTLSMLLRDGWDGRRLETRSRAKVVVATGYHLVTLGHVTVEELRSRLTDTETYGGFANRFLWVCVQRSKRLPDGGNVPDALARRWGLALAATIDQARGVGMVNRTKAATERWAEVYNTLGDDDPGGLLGAVLARAEPMALRLSLLYALLDGSRAIDVEHAEAAWALWRYARDSAAYVFGDATGNGVADRLRTALHRAGPEGVGCTNSISQCGGLIWAELNPWRGPAPRRHGRRWREQPDGRAALRRQASVRAGDLKRPVGTRG